MTEPEGWLRAYLDVGAPMERTLTAFLDTPADETPDASALPHAYIARLLAAFAQEKQDVRSPAPHGIAAASPALIEPLTRREREVLRHLAHDGQETRQQSARQAGRAQSHAGHCARPRRFPALSVFPPTSRPVPAQKYSLL
jgi:hypothetical protein